MCLAIPGKVLAIDGATDLYRQATVDFGGIRKDVSLALLPDAREGDYVLVHAGIGITVVDEAEAARVFEYLDAIGDLDDLEAEPR